MKIRCFWMMFVLLHNWCHFLWVLLSKVHFRHATVQFHHRIASLFRMHSRCCCRCIRFDVFPWNKWRKWKKSIKFEYFICLTNRRWKQSYLLVCCFSCNICTYSQAFDKMPPFDWPSMAAMLGRPVSPISIALPSAGMMLPSFIIQWLILSRRRRSTSLCVARRRSSRFLNELNGSMCEVWPHV